MEHSRWIRGGFHLEVVLEGTKLGNQTEWREKWLQRHRALAT